MLKEIIKELSDPNTSLAAPLLKLKVIAKRIKNQDLYSIVSKELSGYDVDDGAPSYRYATANSFATIMQDGFRYENQPIPVMIFREEQLRELLLKFPIYSGIEGIENMVKQTENDTMMKPFGADFAAFLTQQSQESGQQFHFSNVRVTTHISQVVSILGKIRERFLDFALQLESEFPEIDSQVDSPLPDENDISKSASKFLAQVNITATGHGNVINTGNHSPFSANVSVEVGNVQSLKRELENARVSEDDIAEVVEIVQTETHDNQNGKFGPKVNGWIQKMMGKALDGTWKIGIGAAGGLLARAIGSYYGIG